MNAIENQPKLMPRIDTGKYDALREQVIEMVFEKDMVTDQTIDEMLVAIASLCRAVELAYDEIDRLNKKA